MVHLEDLVGLAEPVPGAVVLAVDVDGAPVGLDGRVRVLDLDVLVAHERPGGQKGPVEGQCAPEVHDRFFVLGFQAVVVADDAACFRAELVRRGGELREEGEPRPVRHDVQHVGVVVQGVEAVRVPLDEEGEDGRGFVVRFGVIVQQGALGEEECRGREDAEEFGEGGVDFGAGEVERLRSVDVEEKGEDVVGEKRIGCAELWEISDFKALLFWNDGIQTYGFLAIQQVFQF